MSRTKRESWNRKKMVRLHIGDYHVTSPMDDDFAKKSQTFEEFVPTSTNATPFAFRTTICQQRLLYIGKNQLFLASQGCCAEAAAGRCCRSKVQATLRHGRLHHRRMMSHNPSCHIGAQSQGPVATAGTTDPVAAAGTTESALA